MDFQSAMETFAEAWVAANTQTPLTEAAEAQSLTLNSGSSTVAPTGGGGGGGGTPGGGAGGVPGNGPATPPLAPHGSPAEEQDRTSSSCDAPTTSRPPSSLAGKSLPVHCVLERVPSPQTENQQPCVEVDSYAIVPCAALFSDLVRTALSKLGYSPCEATCAKGVIQIKNWKPLSFDQITELPEATVGDILGDLQGATLRIRLYSIPSDPDMWNMDSVKTAVIQLLKEMSQSKLAKICPLKQSLLSTIVNNKFNGKLGAEKCKEFGRWFISYRQSSPVVVSTFLDQEKPPQDCRMTFHSGMELPRMREWYRQCPHPTNVQLQEFVNQLNCGSLRIRNKPKVTLNSLKNWWKNERQRERRLKRPAAVDGSCPPSKTQVVPSQATPCSHAAPCSHVTPTLSGSGNNGVTTTRPHSYVCTHDCLLPGTPEQSNGRNHLPIHRAHHHHLHHHHHHPNSGGVGSGLSSGSHGGELVVALSPTSPS